jgi:hypothetical protein
MMARQINTAYQSSMNNDIKTMLKNVYNKLVRYNDIIEKYKNIPNGLRTSIGMEYEVTKGIAR